MSAIARPEPSWCHSAEELGRAVIGEESLDSYFVTCSGVDALRNRIEGLYGLVNNSSLSLLGRAQALSCVEEANNEGHSETSNLDQNDIANPQNRDRYLAEIRQICHCFCQSELESLGLNFRLFPNSRYGYELPSENLITLFEKQTRAFKRLVRSLSQLSIRYQNVRDSLGNQKINLDDIFGTLENLVLKANPFPFSERRLVLAWLKRLQAFKDLNPASSREQSYQRIDALCRTVPRDTLSRWGINPRGYAIEDVEYVLGSYKLSDNVFNEISSNKAKRNAQKALTEHIERADQEDRKCFFTLENLNSVGLRPIDIDSVQIFTAENQGTRDYMQDAHFCIPMREGILAGVFDGHGKEGGIAAKIARDTFEEKLPLELKQGRSIDEALLLVMEEAHQLILDDYFLDEGGSTAVVTFIDREGEMHTANVGDGEIFAYRIIDGQMRCLPCSVVRDWGSKKDMARVGDPWDESTSIKHRRFPNNLVGINLSRSLGERWIAEQVGEGKVPHKPKITQHQIGAGDTLFLTSDGILDCMSQKEIISCMQSDNPADEVIQAAKGTWSNLDNLSAIVIKF